MLIDVVGWLVKACVEDVMIDELMRKEIVFKQ